MAGRTVAEYVTAIDPRFRGLFVRVRRLVLEARPDAREVLSYGMPTFRVGRRRLHVGVWAHGVSLYGWRDDGFLARHPQLRTSTGTIRLRLVDAERIGDDDLRDLARHSLGEDRDSSR